MINYLYTDLVTCMFFSLLDQDHAFISHMLRKIPRKVSQSINSKQREIPEKLPSFFKSS